MMIGRIVGVELIVELTLRNGRQVVRRSRLKRGLILFVCMCRCRVEFYEGLCRMVGLLEYYGRRSIEMVGP